MKKTTSFTKVAKVLIFIFCVFLAILSVMPFVIMLVNSTRSTTEIQQHAVSLIPSRYLTKNLSVLLGKTFKPMVGFTNSMIISVCSTALATYFSTLTAYGLVVYDWKFKNAYFSYLSMLILPAIASPSMVFFMRQYMKPALSMEIVQSARIDGAGEFFIFNRIALPIMKPAIATQAIFSFVSSWNRLFEPLILLTDQKKYTLPIMISLLRGDIYKTEYGAVYLGLAMTALPLIIVYLALSKYIIAGVALGSVKG